MTTNIGDAMKNLSKIVCVVDPTTKTQHAVSRASWLARLTGAELNLFICYYNEYLSGDRFFDSRSLAKARQEVVDGHLEYLESLAAPLRESGLNVTTTSTWDHPLHDGVVRHATECNASMVVKDTHYHSGAARILLSNTDWQLIRTVAAPLWLVKPREISDRPVFVAAIDPMNEHDKPAALDDEILITSKMLAAAAGGDLRAFHAYDPRIAIATASANAYLPVSLPMDEIEQQMREQHGKRFNSIVAYHGIREDHAHLISGRTFEELPALAIEQKADVVVMGAVARNRWKRLFVGATAERTLDHLPCDMLIIKPDWFKTPADILHHDEEAA
ncbi:MAG: universal stress protein [Woeseia sp.]|nr:universal stress protein [Woeseia sp.]